MVWVGIEIVYERVPTLYPTPIPIPDVDPIPIDCFGLKYTMSFTFDSKYGIDLLTVNVFGK